MISMQFLTQLSMMVTSDFRKKKYGKHSNIITAMVNFCLSICEVYSTKKAKKKQGLVSNPFANRSY
jgi:hypothetical protein